MSVSKIQLVISGLDGTLLTSDNELSPDAQRVAVDLYYSGIQLCFVSPRTPRSILPIVRALGVRAPFAAFNGAVIMLPDGQVLFQETLPGHIAQRVTSITTHLGLTVWLYDDKEWYASTRTPFVDRESMTAGFLPQLENFNQHLKRPMSKVTIVGTPDVVMQAEARVRGDLARVCSISRPNPRYLDLTPLNCDKTNVLHRFSRMFNVTPDRIAVIGHSPDSIELFKQVGLSIAMGNAVDNVRTYAQFSTASNDEGGWARAISQHILLRG